MFGKLSSALSSASLSPPALSRSIVLQQTMPILHPQTIHAAAEGKRLTASARAAGLDLPAGIPAP
jgi:hypothetical protein